MIPYGLEHSDFEFISREEAHELVGTDEGETLWKMKDSSGNIIFYRHRSVPHMRENKKAFRRRARKAVKERIRKKMRKLL